MLYFASLIINLYLKGVLLMCLEPEISFIPIMVESIQCLEEIANIVWRSINTGYKISLKIVIFFNQMIKQFHFHNLFSAITTAGLNAYVIKWKSNMIMVTFIKNLFVLPVLVFP